MGRSAEFILFLTERLYAVKRCTRVNVCISAKASGIIDDWTTTSSSFAKPKIKCSVRWSSQL